MLPSALQPERFRQYPPQARAFSLAHLALLRQLPTIYVASLLRQIACYDWQFPAERNQVDRQLAYLASLSPQQLSTLFAGFAQIRLDRELEDMDWVKEPEAFSARLSAWLWSTHQIDAFRAAATGFVSKVAQATPVQAPPMSRLCIAVVGCGVEQSDFPLFRKLRPHGTHFTNIDPENGMEILLDAVNARAAAQSAPYGHWYIEGGTTTAAPPHVTIVSYDALQPVRAKLLDKMQQVLQSGSGGPELMEVTLAQMSPAQLGMTGAGENAVLDHFQVSLLTQGSGTQIFSTTFVQWAAREALRRAEPVTLLAHFTPRQRQRPMNELLSGKPAGSELDAHGSLMDADMGSYYIWLDQKRLPDEDRASFLVWFEGHSEAVAVAPGLPRGTESSNRANLRQVLQWIS